MKLCRKITTCAVSTEYHGIHLIALRELHHLVKPLPVAVKGELELHILDLVVCQYFSLDNFNALVLYKKLPHQSRTSVHSPLSSSYCI